MTEGVNIGTVQAIVGIMIFDEVLLDDLDEELYDTNLQFCRPRQSWKNGRAVNTKALQYSYRRNRKQIPRKTNSYVRTTTRCRYLGVQPRTKRQLHRGQNRYADSRYKQRSVGISY